MLTFTNGSFQINIVDSTATYEDHLSSFDAIHLNPDDYSPVSTQTIEIFEDDQLVKRILLGATGGGTGVWDNTALMDDDKVVTCCSNTVYCLAINNGELLWKTQADQATCFCIYQHKQDYIIHGELEISRLNRNGKIIWQHGGADIFVTLEGDSDIKLLEDCIVAIDFENSTYKFDYDGNAISYTKA